MGKNEYKIIEKVSLGKKKKQIWKINKFQHVEIPVEIHVEIPVEICVEILFENFKISARRNSI